MCLAKLVRGPFGGEELGPLRAMTTTSVGLSLVLNIVGYPIALSRYLIGVSPPIPIILTPGIPILFSSEDPELNRLQRLEGLFDILKLFEKGMIIYI
jgi:hypothetical protein